MAFRPIAIVFDLRYPYLVETARNGITAAILVLVLAFALGSVPARSEQIFTGGLPDAYQSPVGAHVPSRFTDHSPDQMSNVIEQVHPVTGQAIDSTNAGQADILPAKDGAAVSRAVKGPEKVHYITGCETITEPGTYILTRNLVVNDTCLTIQPPKGTKTLNGVHIECNGKYSITSTWPLEVVQVNHSDGLTIDHCTFGDMEILSSNNFKLTKNTLGQLGVYDCRKGELQHNHLKRGYHEARCFSMNVSRNSFLGDARYLIYSQDGGDNLIFRNTMDGGWKGGGDYKADDGIVIDHEAGDKIIRNDIQNTYDTGIETVNTINGLTIAGNHIRNVEYAGIGGWWNNSWAGVTIVGNTVTDSPGFLNLELKLDTSVGPIPTVARLQNVTVKGNTFIGSERHPQARTPQGVIVVNLSIQRSPRLSSEIKNPTLVTGQDIFSGNTIQNNYGPSFPNIYTDPRHKSLFQGVKNNIWKYGPAR